MAAKSKLAAKKPAGKKAAAKKAAAKRPVAKKAKPATKKPAGESRLEALERKLALTQRQLAKEKGSETKTAGKKRSREDGTMDSSKPKLVTYSAYHAGLEAEPSILDAFVFVRQLLSVPAGLLTLADQIKSQVGDLRSALKTRAVMQHTATLVIQNSSGVGKTFGSVAVAGILNSKDKHAENADYYLPMYVGLNDVFPITETEINLLLDQSQQTDMEGRVRAVIGRRLLLQLKFISDKLANANLKLWDVVECKEGHYTPAPSESTFNSHMEFPLFTKEVMARCTELIQRLSEYCGKRKLVVLFIIDEGQMLDEHIAPKKDKKEGGARFALRLGRELQRSCSMNTKDAFLLPVMTGINPVTSLGDGTEGNNFLYSKPLNTVDEFVEIALSLDVKRDGAGAQERNRRLTALFYPVARDVKRVYDAAKKKFFGNIFPEVFDLAPSRAQLMVMASGTETKVPISKWETRVPAIFSDSQFLPVPSFYHLSRNYLLHFKGLQLGTETFGVSALNALSLQDYHGFETASIDILNAILSLTNMPGEPDVSDAVEYQQMRKAWLKQNKWFNLTHLSPGTDISLIPMDLFKSLASHRYYLPSSNHTNQAEAFSVTGSGNTHSLHPDIRTELGGLRQQGELFSMVCGASAPIDFIFVFMKTSRKKDTDPCEVELRLADAKHTTAPHGTVPKVTTMLEKFSLVSTYLRAALQKECNMTVTGEQFSIITNVKNAGQSMLGRNADLSDIIAKTHVLSPATLRFPPFTTRLFD